MAVCFKFDQEARRKHVLHVSDIMGQLKIVIYYYISNYLQLCFLWLSGLLPHVDSKYKCGFESHYQHYNFNVLFLLNLTVKFKITKLNCYLDIHYTLGLLEFRINRPKAMSPAYLVVSMMLNHPTQLKLMKPHTQAPICDDKSQLFK